MHTCIRAHATDTAGSSEIAVMFLCRKSSLARSGIILLLVQLTGAIHWR